MPLEFVHRIKISNVRFRVQVERLPSSPYMAHVVYPDPKRLSMPSVQDEKEQAKTLKIRAGSERFSGGVLGVVGWQV